jgi:hypothetical protein
MNKTCAGLDRKNPSLGYLLSNVVPCCVVCNKIKNNLLSWAEMKTAMDAVLYYRRTGYVR